MAKKLVPENDLLFGDMAGTVYDDGRSCGSDAAMQKYLKRIDEAARAWVPPLVKNRAIYLRGRRDRR